RLDNFITNILDMANLENGQVKAKSELCDIGGLLRDSVAQMAPRLQDSKVQIKPLSGIVTATIDGNLLQRAVGLLLDNAVKYGGTTSVIDIDYGRNDFARYYIRVRDYGPGVPEPKREAIFCKYTR